MRASLAYFMRSSVRVTTIRRVGLASARAAEAAAARLPNSPKTAEPLPESAAFDAPRRLNASMRRRISG